MRYTKIGKKEQEIVWKSLLNQNTTKYNKIQQNRIGYTEQALLQQNQTEIATSNRINKEEPFQTKIYDSDKNRQVHNNTQQK